MKNIANFIASKTRSHATPNLSQSTSSAQRNQVSPRGPSPQPAQALAQQIKVEQPPATTNSLQSSSSPLVTLSMKLSKSVTAAEANQEANLSVGTSLSGIAAECKKDEQSKALGEFYERIAEGIKKFESARTEMLSQLGTQVVSPLSDLSNSKEKDVTKVEPLKQALLLCDYVELQYAYFQKSLECLEPLLSTSKTLRESTLVAIQQEKERLEKERAEKERIEKENAEKERAEKERLEKEKIEREKAEKERIEKENAEKADKEAAEQISSVPPLPIPVSTSSAPDVAGSPLRYTTVISGKDQGNNEATEPPVLLGYKREKRSISTTGPGEESTQTAERPLSDDSGRDENFAPPSPTSSTSTASGKKAVVSPSHPGLSNSGITTFTAGVASTGTPSKGDFFSRTKSRTWSSKSNPMADPNKSKPTRAAIPNFQADLAVPGDRSHAISGVMSGIGVNAANNASTPVSPKGTNTNVAKPQRAWDSETCGPLLKSSFGDFVNEEEKFCQYMGLVIEKFERPFKEDERLSSRMFEEDVTNIFLHIDEIYKISSKLLVELHFCLRNWPLPTPGLYFLEKIKVLEAYINYAGNYGNAVFSLKRARKLSKSVKQYLEQVLIEEQDLSALLALPLKIIPRWWAFFDSACHNLNDAQDADSKHFVTIAAKLKEYNTEIAFHIEQFELMQQVRAVQDKIQGMSESIAQPGRRFLREGGGDIKPDGVEVQLFLFSDMLIEARPAFSLKKPPTSNVAKTIGKSLAKASKMMDKYKFSRKIMLRRAVITEFGATEPAFKITEGNTSVVYSFDHVVTRAAWVQDLQRTIASLNKNTVFGLPLEDLMTEREKDRDVPFVVEKSINYLIANGLTAEGLFRVCGSQKRIDEFRNCFDNGLPIEFQDDEENEVHAIAGVLKLWIRSLPTPLIVIDLYDDIIAVNRLEMSDKEKAEKLKPLVDKLPKFNKYLLQHLMSFCVLVSAHSESNKMNASNMSIVIGPNILYKFGKDSNDYAAQAASIADQKDVTDVVQMFIDYYDDIFRDIETERRREKEKQRTKPPAPQTPLRKALPPTPKKAPPVSPASASTATATALDPPASPSELSPLQQSSSPKSTSD
eukprot:TRINITY_DN3667_c0_g2_i2.p1 TRINITY_DN3667_c0_g2~~TRINITY_DN3667_c0_g2_i2.p1  ORF type:complete len:1099 (+),score=343.39 TRINITY_DN3667_c0_g2_i2:137-3433(+)